MNDPPELGDDRLEAEEAAMMVIDRALDAGIGEAIDRLMARHGLDEPEDDERPVRTPGLTMTTEMEFGCGVLDEPVLRRARRDADRLAGAEPRLPAPRLRSSRRGPGLQGRHVRHRRGRARCRPTRAGPSGDDPGLGDDDPAGSDGRWS